MIVYIANPLYDAVFKRIMKEERIAKTFLSAILQREVVRIKICQDGFRNIKSNSISIFKMGFVASIKNPRDGKVANPQKMMGKNQITFMRTHATFCGFRQKQIKTFCGFRQNKVKTFCGFRQKLYLCTHNQLIIRQIYIPLWTNSQKSILRESPTNI